MAWHALNHIARHAGNAIPIWPVCCFFVSFWYRPSFKTIQLPWSMFIMYGSCQPVMYFGRAYWEPGSYLRFCKLSKSHSKTSPSTLLLICCCFTNVFSLSWCNVRCILYKKRDAHSRSWCRVCVFYNRFRVTSVQTGVTKLWLCDTQYFLTLLCYKIYEF